MDYLSEINKTPPLYGSDSLANVIGNNIAEDVVNPLRIKGFSTQYPVLNEMGGVKLKSFIVIAAEQGVGKSLLALGIALDLAEKGVSCAYLDFENGEALTVERLIRIRYQLNRNSILQLSAENIISYIKEIKDFFYYSPTKLQKTLDELQFDNEGMTKREMVLEKIRFKAGQGVKVFVLDPYSRICESNATTELYDEGKFAGDLADLADELNIVIIAVHHMRKGNRTKYIQNEDEVNDKSYVLPTLESTRGSSKIVDRATDVWGLVRFRRPSNEPDSAILVVLKNRTGDLRNIKLEFDKDTLTFNPHKLTALEKIFGDT